MHCQYLCIVVCMDRMTECSCCAWAVRLGGVAMHVLCNWAQLPCTCCVTGRNCHAWAVRLSAVAMHGLCD
eukprot:365752-Chlamydomonas_euryale.AAC.2